MTPRELLKAFGSHLNLFKDVPEYTTDDALHWLNTAQLDIVNKLIGPPPGRYYRYVDERTYDTSIIRSLIQESIPLAKDLSIGGTGGQFSPAPSGLSDSESFSLPDNYLSYLHSFSSIKGKTRRNRIVQRDDILSLMDDPFHRTRINSPVCVLYEGGILVYTDGFSVSSLYLTYISQPPEITRAVSTFLPENKHEDLIALAATMFLGNTRDIKQKLRTEVPTPENQTEN